MIIRSPTGIVFKTASENMSKFVEDPSLTEEMDALLPNPIPKGKGGKKRKEDPPGGDCPTGFGNGQ